MIKQLSVRTREGTDLVDITQEVRSAVKKSGVREGTCVVFVPHTTVGVWVNEDEPGLRHDLLEWLDRSVPVRESYRHPDGNAHAHIKAGLVGTTRQFVITDGELLLGTWQTIFLSEFDGPRTRNVIVKVSGD